MILSKPIVGKRLRLRTADPGDAEFILSLRLNPDLNKFLKPVDLSVSKQRLWIRDKQRAANDYHMIIELRNGERQGVIAIYNIKEKRFDWGRWVISPGASFYVAFESMALLYRFAFEYLELTKTCFETQKLNKRVIDFHKMYGAKIYDEDAKFIYLTYTRRQFRSNNRFYSLGKFADLGNRSPGVQSTALVKN